MHHVPYNLGSIINLGTLIILHSVEYLHTAPHGIGCFSPFTFVTDTFHRSVAFLYKPSTLRIFTMDIYKNYTDNTKWPILVKIVGRGGLEPPTYGLLVYFKKFFAVRHQY